MSAARSWRDVLPVHAAASLFPMLSREELLALGEDIKANGQAVPIIFTKDGELLDGRNRLAAMELVGLPIFREKGYSLNERIEERWIDTPDPFAYVISANIHRRHLNAEQRRELIAQLLKATPDKSNRQIAEQVKADDKTVGKVRKALEATAEIPQLDKTTGKDGKTRKAPDRSKTSVDALSQPASNSAEAQLESVTSPSGRQFFTLKINWNRSLSEAWCRSSQTAKRRFIQWLESGPPDPWLESGSGANAPRAAVETQERRG